MVGLFRGRGKNGFGYATAAEEVIRGLDLSGQRILVTGCNSGIGLESIRVLSQGGATVLAVARTSARAEVALSRCASPGVPLGCDLSDPASVRACVARVRESGEPVHAVIANAGIMALPERQLLHRVERQLFTNHVGHFLLITGLLDSLTSDGRVVVVSSSAHRRVRTLPLDDLAFDRGYSPFRAYGRSKLANLLFARELGRRFGDSDRVAVAIHPGVIATNLGRHMNAVMRAGFRAIGPLFLKSAAQGAATQVYAAIHPEAAAHNGEYLADCNPARSTRLGRDRALARELWQVTEELVATL